MVSARRRAALLPLAMLLALALSVQATTDSRRATFTIPIAPIALGLDALPLVTPEGAVRRVALVLRDDLRLPLPSEVTLRLYATPKLFEQGLVQDGGVAPSLAATISGLAVGASLESSLFLLEPSIGLGRSADSRRGVREWLRLVAHEMTHVGQVELAGGQGRASQWMAEGVADWASLVVLDRLRLQPMQAERDGRLASIHAPRAPIDLDGLDDPRDFIERSRRDGTDTTYGVSFALADRLIDRYGFARTREYFQAFAHERDRALNFRAVFGETPEDLARRLWPAACHC
jgi:hypothetical protein